MSHRRPSARFAVLGLFLLLAVAHTWPLATAPGRLSRNDNADTLLNEWIVAWVAHQAPRDPRHLFDANIFYPEQRTLAYSELLIAPAAMGAPLLWLGASPVLVYNLLLILGLALSGWTACLLLWRWTDDLVAGLVTGVLFAFNAHTLTRLPQLQALHMEFLPLALLSLDALLTSGRQREPRCHAWRAALGLGLSVTLQGVTSYYGLILMLTALTVSWLVRPEDWWGREGRAPLAGLAASAVFAAVVLLPFLWPYTALGQVRSLEEVAQYSAGWRDYLASPARVHYELWSARWFGGVTALFPGVTSLVLAGVGLAMSPIARNRRARAAVAFGVVGVALSFGPALPGYGSLYAWLLPLQGIRNAARFGYLGIVACAILAGFGVAALRERWPRARWMPAAAILLVVCANLDAFAAPLDYVDAERVPALFERLRGTRAVVAHFPFYTSDRLFHNADYMLESTAHWRPILNGYSGLTPASYDAHARALQHFPEAASIAALRAAGVTHVFVNDRALRDWTDNETADAVGRSPDLLRLGVDGPLALYQLRP